MKQLFGLIGAVIVGTTAGFLGYRAYEGRGREAAIPVSPSSAPAPPASASPSNDSATRSSPASVPPTERNAPEEALPPPARTVPRELPTLSLPDLAGKAHSLQEYRGHTLLVNFWATWCEPCRREIPLLRSLPRRYAKDRLQVVGIAIDQASAVREYLQRNSIDYPLLIGESGGMDMAARFGMEPELPFTVFADAQGRVLSVKLGELHADDADAILRALRAYASGTLDLAGARQQIGEDLKSLAARRAAPRS